MNKVGLDGIKKHDIQKAFKVRNKLHLKTLQLSQAHTRFLIQTRQAHKMALSWWIAHDVKFMKLATLIRGLPHNWLWSGISPTAIPFHGFGARSLLRSAIQCLRGARSCIAGTSGLCHHWVPSWHWNLL